NAPMTVTDLANTRALVRALLGISQYADSFQNTQIPLPASVLPKLVFGGPANALSAAEITALNSAVSTVSAVTATAPQVSTQTSAASTFLSRMAAVTDGPINGTTTAGVMIAQLAVEAVTAIFMQYYLSNGQQLYFANPNAATAFSQARALYNTVTSVAGTA